MSRDIDEEEDPFVQEPSEIEEAIVRFRRRQPLEALIHIERAIPELSGLHDAVLNLKAQRP